MTAKRILAALALAAGLGTGIVPAAVAASPAAAVASGATPYTWYHM